MLFRSNVVDLAVGIVIGTAFGKVVDSLVRDIFMPIIGVITGGFDVSGQSLELYKDARLGWGAFIQTIVSFTIVGFCLFLVVKGMNALHKYVLKDEAGKVVEPTASETLLGEIRDLLKEQVAKDRPAIAPPAAT